MRLVAITVIVVWLSAVAAGQGANSRPPASAASRPDDATIVLRGLVRNSWGEPIEHARVTLARQVDQTRWSIPIKLREGPFRPRCLESRPAADERQEPWNTVETDARGRFAASVPADDPAWLRVEAPGYAYEGLAGVRPRDGEVEIVLKPGAVLRGRVVSARNGEPIRGASISAGSLGVGRGEVTRSAEDGSFELRDLPIDIAWMRARHPDFLGNKALPPLRLDPGSPKEVTITLDPGVAMTGVVVDGVTGAPIEGAMVAADASEFHHLRTECKAVTTDPNGRFEIKGLLDSWATVGVSARGHVEALVAFDLADRGLVTSVGTIPVQPGGRIELQVLDPDRKPVQGALADVGDLASWSDGSGILVIDGIPKSANGMSRVAIHASGFDDQTWSGDAESRPASRPEVVLARSTGEITGRVIDDAGEPVRGARVDVQATSGFRVARTDENGSFVFSGVGVGRWSVTAWASGYASLGRKAEVQLNHGQARRDTEIVLVRVASATVMVRSATGESIRNASLAAARADPPDKQAIVGTQSSNSGQFSISLRRTGAKGHVHVFAAGYQARDVAAADLLRDDPAVVVLDPLPDARVLRGTVIDAATREPIADADVHCTRTLSGVPDAWDEDSALSRQSVSTANDGTFELRAPLGLVHLGVSPPLGLRRRYVRFSRSVVVSSDDSFNSLTVNLTSGSALVVFAASQSLDHLRGILVPFDRGAEDYRAEYEPMCGCFVFADVQPGEYRLAIGLSGEPSTSSTLPLACLKDSVIVPESRRTDLHLELEAMGTLVSSWQPATSPASRPSPGAASRMTSAESRPEEARIEVIALDGRPLNLWLRPGRTWEVMSSTSYRVGPGDVIPRKLPPGRFLVRFHHPGFVAAEQTIEIRGSQETRIHFDATTLGK